MVPNASDDLPDPETPVKTTSASRGTSTSTLRRLCSRAPRTRTQGSVGEAAGAERGRGGGGARAGWRDRRAREQGGRGGGQTRVEAGGVRPRSGGCCRG